MNSDTAMTQCSEILLQLYCENNNFRYDIQQTREKTKLIVLNSIICSRYAEKEGKKAIPGWNLILKTGILPVTHEQQWKER